MSTSTTALDPVRDPRWNAFIDGCPEATAFHHPVSLLYRHVG